MLNGFFEKNSLSLSYFYAGYLLIRAGDIVTTKQIESSISRIWNIGNFAGVNYRIDTLENGRLLLNVTAHDALTIMPILSFSGNKKEYILTVGAIDNNLFGRNIYLGVEGSFGTNARYANINLGIPRQLLYRNMTLKGGFSYGVSSNFRYGNGSIISGIAYMQKNINLLIGNPYHTDYYYTFSPNLGISYFNHRTDSTLLENGIPPSGNYTVNYLTLSVSESIGTLNHIRHQRDGYVVSAGMEFGLGLDNESPGYISLGLAGIYSKLLNRIVQLDTSISSSYTTAELPSLISYLGPGQVKGILS